MGESWIVWRTQKIFCNALYIRDKEYIRVFKPALSPAHWVHFSTERVDKLLSNIVMGLVASLFRPRRISWGWSHFDMMKACLTNEISPKVAMFLYFLNEKKNQREIYMVLSGQWLHEHSK